MLELGVINIAGHDSPHAILIRAMRLGPIGA